MVDKIFKELFENKQSEEQMYNKYLFFLLICVLSLVIGLIIDFYIEQTKVEHYENQAYLTYQVV